MMIHVPSTDPKDLLFFDIEVYPHDAFVIFKDINKKVVGVFHNTFDGVYELIKGKTVVGFNNYHYDDVILTYMISMWTPQQLKVMNDDIIIRNRNMKSKVHHDIVSLDMMQQISVGGLSLKAIEGNMGKMILESGVDFNIDRPLTEEELETAMKYCGYDVDMVIEIWHKRLKYYILPKMKLLEMIPPQRRKYRMYRWNTTTLSAHMLLDRPLPKWSGLRVPEEMMEIVPEEVKQMWLQVNQFGKKVEQKECTVKEFNNNITFSFGGLHGVHTHITRAENIKLLDVASMYPSIIINLGVLGPATKMYKELKEKRVALKKTDPVLAEAYKLILNSIYGLLRSQYSALYNPRALDTICVYGQIALYDLSKRLSTVAEVLNINTDGVFFKTSDDRYKEIWKQWEKDYNLDLDEEHYDILIQKDVNNYVAKDIDGEIKARGADIKRNSFEDSVFLTNNIRIVDYAMKEKVLNGKDVLETIMENLDRPELFQYVLKAGPTYKGTFDEDGHQYQKVNRVFAVKKGEGPILYKKREDDGLVRFPDTPDKMVVWNDECAKFLDFKDLVDLSWYYQLTMGKLERWDCGNVGRA